MTQTCNEIDNLNRSVSKLKSALNGLEEAKTMVQASEQFVSAIKRLELSEQFRMRREKAAKRGQRELERLYQECEEIIAGSNQHEMIGDLSRIKTKLLTTMVFLSEPHEVCESHDSIGRC